jgi:hypothetical protein
MNKIDQIIRERLEDGYLEIALLEIFDLVIQ